MVVSIDIVQALAPAPARALTPVPPYTSDSSRPGTPPSEDAIRANIAEITDEFFAPGSPAATFLERFVQGQGQIPLTTGLVPGLPRVLLRKEKQSDVARPSLLFLDLPDPSAGNVQSKRLTSDAILDLLEKDRTQTVPIFGVSGCGKTRGLIELLSRRWGFYFSGSGNDLGSDDLSNLAREAKSRRMKNQDGSYNRTINTDFVRKLTYLLFLARLKILQYCLKVPNIRCTFTCARWTLLQVCPHVFSDMHILDAQSLDVFNTLFERFREVKWGNSEHDLKRVFREEFKVTKGLLYKHNSVPQFQNNNRLLAVLDDAQELGDQDYGSYESMFSEKADRSVLSPILHGFRNIGREADLTLVTSGTTLSIYTLTWSQCAGSMLKHGPNNFSYMEFGSWTGVESVMAYLANLRDQLPTEDAKQALDALLPSEAIQAITSRFVGRHRPAITAIERTIMIGEPDGWKRAVNDTERKLVSFEFHKEPGNLCYEIVRFEKKSRDNLDTLNEYQTVGGALGLLLFQRYMFGTDTLVLEELVPEFVEHALGRINIIEGTERTVVDEPFVLKATENYFKMRDSSFLKTLEYWMQQTVQASAHGCAWELMIMRVLETTFKLRGLSNWQHDPSISMMCATLEGDTEIVGLDEAQYSWRGITHCHISMEEFMDSHANNNSLMQGQLVPPFFFPKPKPSGPDIVFYIRINGNLVPVFLQLKLRQVMTKIDALGTLESVSEPNIKKHVKGFDEYCPANIYIGMIIAYPANLVSLLRPRPDIDFNAIKTRLASLCSKPDRSFQSGGLQQVVIKIDSRNFAAIFPQDHVEFLDSIKTPVK
ncbi:hypothetical protein BGZ83_011149 [Gryganskiella cystojenkinii]|nr:hypothetical protein BGZ83_011149 [Gryganskiella cystojenkinii]